MGLLKKYKNILWAVPFIFFILTGYGIAANNAPIHIEADRMESNQKDSAVHFAGNVVAKQGDLLIKADDMQVFYNEKTGPAAKAVSNDTGKMPTGAQKIKRLFATGNVEIVNQGSVATGDRMDYFAMQRKVLLSGNAQVRQKNNMVSGDKIVFYLDEGRSIVEKNGDSGGRVKAFFYPDSEK